MTVELDFICDTCGRPVDNCDGAIYVRLQDIREHRQAKKDWETFRSPGGAIDLPTLLMMPRPVPWRICHNACAPADIDDVYDIEVEQVRTWRDLVKWTSHLLSKNWLESTNWGSLIGAAAHGSSRQIAKHVRNDAA